MKKYTKNTDIFKIDELSGRAKNCAWMAVMAREKMGLVCTIGDVLQVSDLDFLSTKNCGEKTFREMTIFMEEAGFDWHKAPDSYEGFRKKFNRIQYLKSGR